MTVRWKPLLVLSGMFVVTAVLGLMAIVYAMVPRGSADLLGRARAERKSKEYDRAVVRYRQALQKDGKDPAIHLEMAEMYGEWAEGGATPEKRAELRVLQLRSLAEAANFGKTLAEPRRRLLADALRQDEPAEAGHWAAELLRLAPADLDAHYVMADRALNDGTPDLTEARKHLEALAAEKPVRVRTMWVRARLARQAREDGKLDEILTEARRTALPPEADPVDRMALLRLHVLDAEMTPVPAELAERASTIREEARALVEADDAPPARAPQVGDLLDRVQSALTRSTASADDGGKKALAKSTEEVEQAIESTFRKATEKSKGADLRVARSYAAHLLARGKGAECLEVVKKALASPVAASPAFLPETMELRELAVRAALSDLKDDDRFEKAAPSIKELLSSPSPRYQGLGHLFQGAIDLERSGLVGGPKSPATAAVDAKLRTSALSHLKDAAAQWPNSATAQALYGIALILSQEPGLGRQYLQAARKIGGTLEPRYQIWAAWSMSEAGYPEDAEPIVANLLAQVAAGTLPGDLDETLHLLAGEVAQARGGKDGLRKAKAEYLKAIEANRSNATAKKDRTVPAAAHLRVAQLEVLQGHPDQALNRIAELRKVDQAGPAGERLSVLILMEQKHPEDARKALDAARAKYPDNGELAGLDAALLVKSDEAGQTAHSQQADRLLADYLAKHPDNLSALQMRAQILADRLGKLDEARRLLSNAAEHADNTAPLVQLAMLELAEKDHAAASRAIAKIRVRWKEAAAADLLDAQLATARGNPRGASLSLEAALKKDPNNKVAQFWKAQLDDQAGAGGEAAKVYAEIARENPTKQLADGLNLTTASRWAMATQALENQELDAAIAGYQGILKGGDAGPLARPARWKLVAAYATKGRWPAAKEQLQSLLKERDVSDEERVQAANYFRMNKEEAAATELLDAVLKASPSHPSAVVTKAYMLANDGKSPEAVALLDRAVATDPKAPPVLSLMLAAIENGQTASAGGLDKALAALDRGLKAHPDAVELIEARYRLLKIKDEPKGAGLAFVEASAKSAPEPRGPVLRLLAEVYRKEGRADRAEDVAAQMAKADPKDPNAALLHARMAVARVAESAGADVRPAAEKAARQIQSYRKAFPQELAFAELECEVAARRGDLPRALAITKEMDAQDRTSAAAPILRAKLYEARNMPREAADAYAEAVDRNPRRTDVRLALGQASLAIGQPDEAVKQADLVLGNAQDSPPAQLLKARGLAAQEGNPSARQSRREEAAALLTKAIAAQPKFADAHHLLAEIRLAQGRRADAITALKDARKANPDDHAALSMLVQALSEPPAKGREAEPDAIKEARTLAEQAAARSPEDGEPCMAAAIGFRRAGHLDLAIPWAEKGARLLDLPNVHLAYGDLLLSAAEAQTEPIKARDLFEQSVAQYDLVLKAQPDALEAVNNKAWVLHRHLKDDKAALALIEGFLRKADPAALPGEFYDTLGAIQEGMGRPADAEASYAKGLRKNPDLPVLNYHMGRLVAADRARAGKATDYLQKAQDAAEKLRPADREEVAQLLQNLGR